MNSLIKNFIQSMQKDMSFNKCNYLPDQFKDYEQIFEEIKQVVLKTDFTLGKAVDELK